MLDIILRQMFNFPTKDFFDDILAVNAQVKRIIQRINAFAITRKPIYFYRATKHLMRKNKG